MASSQNFWRDFIDSFIAAATRGRKKTTSSTTASSPGTKKATTKPTAPATKAPRLSRKYPGDFTGTVAPSYTPKLDGNPDPGEVVWTWVPFEEDFSDGKDRPVLLIGRDGDWLLGLMLTSKDHDRDAADEARWGRYWMDIGTGDWDRERRPSEVRLDRVIRVNPKSVRREGAILDSQRFDSVIRSMR